MDEPLIYTSKGNLPLSSLEYKHEWIDNDNETTLVEEYRLDGEVVKRSVHVRLKTSVCAEGGVASFF